MTSLYDKYYSEHNKTYMYKLINGIILKDHQIDVSTNVTYNQFFQTNFLNTFNTVNTEEIKDLNNHLLTTQLEYFLNFILKQTNLTKIETPELYEDYVVHSFKRKINLKSSSRHNFRITSPKNKYVQIDKVIIPIEESYLFMNPILLITLDKSTVELHLRGTINVHNRAHGIYSPFYDKPILIKGGITRIQFKNQLYNLRDGCDVYKIIDNTDNKIVIKCDLSEFKEGDYIRINNYESIDNIDDSILKKQYRILSVHKKDDNIELEVEGNLSDVKDLYIMNLSLQNSIHLINPE